jgi:hypothetical protein
MRTRAVTAAIRQAVSDREINDELISNTLRKLEQDGIVHSQTLTALIGCRNSHHDRYFELQKANAKEEIWLHEFGLARLYSALVNASDTASYEASCEAIYECLSGMDDPMPTVGRLLDSLRTDDV